MFRRIWIGGSPCSGKSSVAESLGSALDLPVYHADEFFDQHAKRASSDSVFACITTWSPEQIFLRDIGEMLADFVKLAYEEFPMILADLSKEDYQEGVIVEGCAILPELVKPLLDSQNEALCLIPTEQFQRLHYAKRPWKDTILEQTSDPKQAWENWRIRDVQYSEVVRQQAEDVGIPIITVDETLSQDDVYRLVKSHLSIASHV